MELSEIKKVLILGSGTLGLRVGLACAIHGYKVVIYDISNEALYKAREIQQALLGNLLKAGKISESQKSGTQGKIEWTTDAQLASNNVDLISESVTEDRAVKELVWAEFGKICPEKTIFTTNTSYMLPSMFAEISGRPTKFCALHFHDVFFANVVDIMPHPQTDHALLPLLVDFGKTLDQIPVVIEKESHGYVFNAILTALLGAAGALVTNDVSTIENVDRSWMGNFKMPLGPFGMLDEIGLDTAWHVVNGQNDRRSQTFAAFLQSYISEGKLGVKTNEGFYKYPNPSFKDSSFLIN